MSTISNFLVAQTNKDKANAIAELEAQYGYYSLEFCEQISISNEWDKDTQLATIERYLKSREEYLTESEKFFSIDFDDLTENTEENKLFDYHLRLMSLVQYMGGDLSEIVDKSILLALHDDVEVKGCGSILILRSANYLSAYMPEILQIMSKHGLWERPFKIGKVFNKIIDRHPESLDLVTSKLEHSEDTNLITSILFALSERKLIPDVCDRHLNQYIKHGKGEFKSIALLTIGVKPELAKTLENDIWSSLESKEWFIRGNAATVCGRTKLNPSRFLPKLTEMLTDFEGHDWCPAESAISAIAKYEKQVTFALPAIENAIKEWNEKWGEENDEFIQKCQKVITQINSLA